MNTSIPTKKVETLLATFLMLLLTTVLYSPYLIINSSIFFCNKLILPDEQLTLLSSSFTDPFTAFLTTSYSETFLQVFLGHLELIRPTTSSFLTAIRSPLTLFVVSSMLACDGAWTSLSSNVTDDSCECMPCI